MRILRLVVHSVLATKYHQASKHNIKFEETFGVAAGGVKQRAASHGVDFCMKELPKQQKLDFGAKQVRVGEL